MTDRFQVYFDAGKEPALVASADELDALFDRIEADVEYQRLPALVQVCNEQRRDRVLQVGVGRPADSTLLWFDKSAGESARSRGGEKTQAAVMYDFGGNATEIAPEYVIDRALARQAAHEYLRTGQRPTCVEWRQ